MKKIYTSITLSLFLLRCFAYSGGPDLYGYTFKDMYEPGGPQYGWIDITTMDPTEVKLLADDNTVGPYDMNFEFPFYWYTVDKFWVGSNGYMIFENGQLSSQFPLIPAATLPNNFIAPFMNDLNFAAINDSASCWYWISLDKDSLIVSWINVPFYDSNPNTLGVGNNTFQVILSTVDSSITFQYKTQVGTSAFSFTQVGIENNSGQIGLSPFSNYNPPSGYAIKFYYPTNPTLQVSDASTIFNNNAESGGLFLNENGLPYTLTSMVKNVGNQVLPPFVVNAQVTDPFGAQVVTTAVSTDTLQPAQEQLLTFPATFDLAGALGTYTFTSTTALPGDYTALNDSKSQELVVLDTTQTDIRLGYDANNVSLLFYLSWIGGEGGAGMYFIPPFYPVQITKVHCYIASNVAAGFSMRVFDDDGVNGLPYTEFDSIYVPYSNVVIGWNDITLPTPIIITSGGFYVSWDMQGENINLGCSMTPPFSNRSFEVLQNTFAIYRYREFQDPLINATIEDYSFPTGENGQPLAAVQMDVYPNPVTTLATVVYEVADLNADATVTVSSVDGRTVKQFNLGKQASGTHHFTFNSSELNAGVYLIQLHCGRVQETKRLVVLNE